MMESVSTPAPRIPLDVEISFRRSYAREDSMGILRNISLSGAFICQENHAMNPGDKIQVVLQVSGRVRKIQAKVVWKNHTGAGVQFLHNSNRDLQLVDDLIYFADSKRSLGHSVFDNILKKVV